MHLVIGHERRRRVFTVQHRCSGQPPQRALALYAVVAYLEIVSGVVSARRGMRALPDGLVAPAPGMVAGRPFSAHTSAQTGPFRPGNLSRGTHDAALAGPGTVVRGVGTPTALLFGNILVGRITGVRSTTYRRGDSPAVGRCG